MLPLFCVIALDMLVCLLTRVVIDATEPDDDEEDADNTVKNKPTVPFIPPPPPPPLTPSNKSTPPSETTATATVEVQRQTFAEVSQKEEAFYTAHGESLVQILMKVTSKLLIYCRLYAMIGNQPGTPSPFTGELLLPALDGIMKLAGRDPLQSKDTKPLFHTHIPDEVRDRLKVWNQALLIDPTHKERLCSHDLDHPISDIIVQFLNLHFCAFTGTRSFDPTRCFKSTLSSLISLLSTLFEMTPQGILDPPDNSNEGPPPEIIKFLGGLVPLSCDITMEFCAADMLKLVKLCGDKVFSLGVTEHRVRESSKLIQLPQIQNCHLLGPLLADYFSMLGALLDDGVSEPVLLTLTPDNTDCSESSDLCIILAVYASVCVCVCVCV